MCFTIPLNTCRLSGGCTYCTVQQFSACRPFSMILKDIKEEQQPIESVEHSVKRSEPQQGQATVDIQKADCTIWQFRWGRGVGVRCRK